MSELKIRLVKNGYLITENDYDYSGEDEYIAATDKDMLAHVVDYFSDRDMQWTGGEIVSGEPWPSSQDSVAAPDEGYDEEPVNTEAMDELLKTDGELYPESPQDTDSTETMVEDMAKRMEEIQSEPQWMTNDRERDTLVENGFHSMSKPVGYGEVEVACEPLPETE